MFILLLSCRKFLVYNQFPNNSMKLYADKFLENPCTKAATYNSLLMYTIKSIENWNRVKFEGE